ncbi:MAG TPA: hypothetical protein VKB95_04605, partial [Chitinophagaceae bacterium]|nr:hypothetical protein [Chitinophagaceae bacterium]
TIVCIMVRLVFATSMKYIKLQHFHLSLIAGAEVTQNISTAESPGRCVQLYGQTFTIELSFCILDLLLGSITIFPPRYDQRYMCKHICR